MRWLLLLAALLLPASAEARGGSSQAARFSTVANWNGDGWLPWCWANFTTTNWVVESNSFTTSPWTTEGVGVAAPTVTANTTDVPAPDGTNTATKLVLPAVTAGSGNHSDILQFPYPGGFSGKPIAHVYTIWMRGAVGGELIAPQVNDAASSVYTAHQGAVVRLGTAWQRYTLQFSVPSGSTTISPIIGVVGAATNPAQTIYIWNAQITDAGPFPDMQVGGSTSAQTLRIACPPNTKFRDLGNLFYSTAINPLTATDGQSYNTSFGLLDSALNGPTQQIGNTYYGIFYGGGASDNSCLPGCYLVLQSGPDSRHTTDLGPSINPIISPVGGTWKAQYVYSASFIPGGAGGHPYAIMYNGSNGSDAIGFATADNVTGPYTDYSGNPIISGYRNPSITVLPDGTLRMDIFSVAFGSITAPVTGTGGIGWALNGVSIWPPAVGDWNYGTFVNDGEESTFTNRHGSCEMYYIMVYGSNQAWQYAVAGSCDPRTAAGMTFFNMPTRPTGIGMYQVRAPIGGCTSVTEVTHGEFLFFGCSSPGGHAATVLMTLPAY